MAATDEQLRLIIDARNNASTTLRQVKSDLGGIEGAVQGLGGLGAIVGAIGVASVAGFGMAAIEMGKLGASAKEMRGSFDDLAEAAGMSGDTILRSLREASEGMVADTELITGANRALMMDAADSVQELAALMEVAKVRSDAVGMSVGEAFATLAESIGRVQERGLYALGIQMDMAKVNEEYAASLGKTAAQLSEVEKRQAMYNAVIAGSADMVASATGLSDADKIDRAATAWANLKTQIAEALSPTVAAGAEAVADAIERMSTNAQEAEERMNLDGLRRALDELEQKRNITLNIVGGDLGALSPQNLAEYQALNKEITALQDELREATGAVDTMASAWPKAGDGVRDYATEQMNADHAIDAATQALIDQANSLNLVDNALSGYTTRLRGMMANLANVAGVGKAISMFEMEQAEIGKTVAAYEAMGWSSQKIATIVNASGDLVADQWQEIIDAPAKAAREAERAARVATGAYEDMVQDAERAHDALTGRVAGVLQSALGDIGGVNVEDFLPREDAVAENARRLAAIMVEGLGGQEWLEEFRREAPDIYAALAESGDPQGAAARMLKEFQAGLRPELLDKDRAKGLVKAAIIGEQNIAALAEEISTELAREMGISLQTARQAAASTLGSGGTGEGSGLIAQGMDGAGEGEQFVDALTGAIKGRAAELFASGQEVGMQWGAGFMAVVESGVPPSLIGLLATLVTPAVMAAFATGNTQRGAVP